MGPRLIQVFSHFFCSVWYDALFRINQAQIILSPGEIRNILNISFADWTSYFTEYQPERISEVPVFLTKEPIAELIETEFKLDTTNKTELHLIKGGLNNGYFTE